MAAAALPASLASLYLCEGVALSPLEMLRIKKELKAFGREPESKDVSLLRGHFFCFLRSVVMSTVVITVESIYYTGFFGLLLGTAAAHPLDTLRTRMALSKRPAKELIKRPWDGLIWALIGVVPRYFLSRLVTVLIADVLGMDDVPWIVRFAGFSIGSLLTLPFEALKRLDQAEMVTNKSVGALTTSSLSSSRSLVDQLKNGFNTLKANPLKLFAGSEYVFAETFAFVLLRRFVADLIYFPLTLVMYPEMYEQPDAHHTTNATSSRPEQHVRA